MKSTLSAAALFTLFSYLNKVALADFPLYIPGFDPQPLSATVLGVGSDGRTTYQISPAKATDSSQDDSSNPTFTLVEGPTDAFYTVEVPVATGSPDIIYESCSFGSNSNGQAVCILSASGSDLNMQGVATETDPVTPFTVMGDAAIGNPSASPTQTGGSGATGGSQPSSTPNGSGSTSSSGTASSPTKTGGAASLTSTGGAFGIAAGFVASLLFAL